MSKQASQTPWIYKNGTVYTKIPDGLTIAEFIRNEANAKLIVKAVNCHKDLLGGLKELLNLAIDLDLTNEENPIIYNAQMAILKAKRQA